MSRKNRALFRSACALASLAALGLLLFLRGRSLNAASERADSLEKSAIVAARARLHAFEEARRRATDFATLPPASRSHGADPYALAELDAQHLVGVLRGASKLVLLDAELRELARAPAPASAVSVVVTADKELWLAGEESARIFRYRVRGAELERLTDWQVPDVLGLRALALGPQGTLYALDVRRGQLLTLRAQGGELHESERRVVGHQPIALERVGDALIVDVLLDHALVVYALDADGNIASERARIVHDGPIWGFAAAARGGELALAAGGVEDRPLDRRDGSFGYIDSFVYTYLLPAGGGARRLRADNVSELKVVTPKALSLWLEPSGRAQLLITGYGSEHTAMLNFTLDGAAGPASAGTDLYPGIASALRRTDGSFVFSDPLLDAWLRLDAAGSGAPARPVAVADPAAPAGSVEERLGEALFFTTLMAPRNSAEGRASRFTCETCHFEGEIDGRIHHTGRGDVRVVTKPLRGLFNNRPHFSRAFDRDLTTVVFNEFRVAGAGSGTDPWSAVTRGEFPWLAALGVEQGEVGPEELRHSLLSFLMGFSHAANPAAQGRSAFSADEQRGAELFRDKCESCHAARLSTDDPASRVSFERWQELVLSPAGPVVWASAEYRKVGVLPYVCELGTRTPSLRRVARKWPHFTNGSAGTLDDVLGRARFDGARFFHASAPADPALHALDDGEQRALRAFLELL